MEYLSGVHDVIVNVTGESLSKEQIVVFLKTVPSEITLLGEEWGYNDTVFRDELYSWMLDNKINKILDEEKEII